MSIGMSYRPLADMESNGVYFEREKELVDVPPIACEYSGLPSVASYVEDDYVDIDYAVGHS